MSVRALTAPKLFVMPLRRQQRLPGAGRRAARPLRCDRAHWMPSLVHAAAYSVVQSSEAGVMFLSTISALRLSWVTSVG